MTSQIESSVGEITVDGSVTVPEVISVHVWEVFLSKNKNNLQSILETYAIDSTPGIHENNGTVVYRFTTYDWNKTLGKLLERNNVPAIIHEAFIKTDN